MIFLTLGTQLPFPRLIKDLDDISDEFHEEIFGQIGNSPYKPNNFKFVSMMSPKEFSEAFSSARVVIAHAGIGTILSGRKFGKPLILMPRRADLGEHRNDHQSATAKQVKNLEGIYIANCKSDLLRYLKSDLQPMPRIEQSKGTPLIDAIRSEIEFSITGSRNPTS